MIQLDTKSHTYSYLIVLKDAHTLQYRIFYALVF
jgi:hypothetical protein